MKKYAALAAVAALTLTGCAAQAAPASIYEAVSQGWEGDNAPANDWVDAAARSVCVDLDAGIPPVVVPDSEHNNEVVVAAATEYACGD